MNIMNNSGFTKCQKYVSDAKYNNLIWLFNMKYLLIPFNRLLTKLFSVQNIKVFTE